MNKICSVLQLEQICIEPNLYTGSGNALGMGSVLCIHEPEVILQCEIVVIR